VRVRVLTLIGLELAMEASHNDTDGADAMAVPLSIGLARSAPEYSNYVDFVGDDEGTSRHDNGGGG
jgi:hypothetical protein